MRQTSEQFADAMLEDIGAVTNKITLAEQLAEMEKRINDKIAETQNNIFSKLETPPDGTPDETDEETIDPEDPEESIEEKE